jgi:sugar lactone lactonase YvrE
MKKTLVKVLIAALALTTAALIACSNPSGEPGGGDGGGSGNGGGSGSGGGSGGGGSGGGGGTPPGGGGPSGEVWVVSTLAGNGFSGDADGTGTEAQFHNPLGMAMNSAGTIYVADANNHRIRQITLEGVVTLLAGSTWGHAYGTGAAAKFFMPPGVAVNSAGTVYVTDNTRICQITPEGAVTLLAGGEYSGYADGTGVAAKFDSPDGVAVNSAGIIYVADNNCIRQITPEGAVSAFVGSTYGYADGTGAEAKFAWPRDVVVNSTGTIYVADSENHRIRKITPEGVVTTLAGSTQGYADGTGAEAKFKYPRGVAVDAAGTIYVADSENYRIRKITPEGVVTTLAGSTLGYVNGTGAEAKFNTPWDVAVNSAGTIVYVTDSLNHCIRKLTRQ